MSKTKRKMILKKWRLGKWVTLIIRVWLHSRDFLIHRTQTPINFHHGFQPSATLFLSGYEMLSLGIYIPNKDSTSKTNLIIWYDMMKKVVWTHSHSLVLHPPPALQLKDVGKNWQGTAGCGGAEGVGDLGSDISGSRRHHSIVASSKTYFSLKHF